MNFKKKLLVCFALLQSAEAFALIVSPDINVMLVNNASIGYSKFSGEHGSFNIIDYNPMILAAYKSAAYLQADLDFSFDDQGNTDTGLGNANINIMLADYADLTVGKADSALGKFVQHLAPPWVNRLPSTPVGFDADEAAPQAEIGMRLRGGVPLYENAKGNYAIFISNGPRAFVDTTNNIIDHITTDGFTENEGNYVVGTRLGFLPVPELELGFSAAAGRVALLDLADSTTVLESGRGYRVLGADASYQCQIINLRAEYVQQEVLSDDDDTSAPENQKWWAWYLQGSYYFTEYNLEPVLRYGEFNQPNDIEKQKQWAIGLDYWFTPSFALQAAYHINHGTPDTEADSDLTTVQLVIGF